MNRGKKNRVSVDAYNAQAVSLADLYNGMSSAAVLPGLEEILPNPSASSSPLYALEMGCGTGRDAVWLADKGFHVVAFDAAEGMIRVAQERKSHPRVQYMVDSLPSMDRVSRLGQKFNVMVMSAVWMHLSPAARKQAVQAMRAMAAPDALIYMSLRHGPAPADRPMYKVSLSEVEKIAGDQGMRVSSFGVGEDRQARAGVWWEYAVLRP